MYNFEKLKLWQKSMDLCESIYHETKKFPKEEMFGLVSQSRRAVTSIPLNIAEGPACKSRKEFKYFLTVSLRSQFELVTLIRLSSRLKFISESNYKRLSEQVDEVGKLLHGLINSLR